ncbi:MAG: dihydrofolate reductase family protein [Pseudonocardia sp.]
MRKVVLYELLSLDGVAEEPGDWFAEVDEAVVDNLGRVIATQDDVLLGRGTYDYWTGYWPTSDVQPFADFINGAPKHVVTSTELGQPWAGARVVGPPMLEYVATLKARPGGDVGVHGSITLAGSLLRAGLVDELRLVVAPAIAGRGRRLFGDDDLRRLELVDVERTPAGALLLDYRARA